MYVCLTKVCDFKNTTPTPPPKAALLELDALENPTTLQAEVLATMVPSATRSNGGTPLRSAVRKVLMCFVG